MPFTTISSLFGASPLRPLQQHMASVQACISQLKPFFEAVIAQHWEEMARLQQEIVRLENVADDFKRELRQKLPHHLFMAIPRAELLEVLTMQDKIANKAKDIAGLITGRRMVIPEVIGPLLLQFVQRSIDACVQAQQAINELDELVETGFSGNEIALLEDMIRKLDEIEGDNDAIQVRIRAELYKVENELNPIHVMFLYRIFDWIGDLADLSQRVGSRLQQMLAR